MMKKRMAAMILIGTMAFSICGCSDKKITENDGVKADDIQTESFENLDVQTDTSEEQEGEFSLSEFKNLEFWFCSGAGGWATVMTINEDGSFSGVYQDSEMGDVGDGYPQGSVYECNFSGQFTQPEKVNDYTYSMRIRELDYEQEVGTEEIKDGVMYRYSDAYGLVGAEDILIYLPSTPRVELSEEFLNWVRLADLSTDEKTELSFYALNNEVWQYGFYSCDIIEELKSNIMRTEDMAASLEKTIEEESLSQAELNAETKRLYDMWDDSLNELWSVLKRTQDEETMAELTIEERAWIAEKEKAVTEAGSEVEGGSMQPMVMNSKGAELTKARVYELLQLLD